MSWIAPGLGNNSTPRGTEKPGFSGGPLADYSQFEKFAGSASGWHLPPIAGSGADIDQRGMPSHNGFRGAGDNA